jgi:hypothetical protein
MELAGAATVLATTLLLPPIVRAIILMAPEVDKYVKDPFQATLCCSPRSIVAAACASLHLPTERIPLGFLKG